MVVTAKPAVMVCHGHRVADTTQPSGMNRRTFSIDSASLPTRRALSRLAALPLGWYVQSELTAALAQAPHIDRLWARTVLRWLTFDGILESIQVRDSAGRSRTVVRVDGRRMSERLGSAWLSPLGVSSVVASSGPLVVRSWVPGDSLDPPSPASPGKGN